MYKADVIAHFGGSQIAVARALGITKSAISQWRTIIPLTKAIKLQAVTGGALLLDMSVYELPSLPIRPASRRAAI
jgi:transcriptional repressor of cell division inhibition gene dicB